MNDQAMNLRKEMNSLSHGKGNKAKTLAIVSGKGGVGKSNFAVNFALELIAKNNRVILFDLDIGMGNIDILLGLHADQTIIDMLNKNSSIYSIIETGPNNLSYIAGGSSLTEVFAMNSEKMDLFLQQYEKVSWDYDYVLFDLGAGVSKDSMFFTLASDETIVITTPEPTSITDAYSIIKHIIARKSDMPLYVVMNRAKTIRAGSDILRRFLNITKQFLQLDIYELGVLPDDSVVTNAVMKQTPFIILNKKSAVSQALKIIVGNYTNKTPIENLDSQTTFIERLKQFFLER